MKYQPDYPDRFGSLVDARTWAQAFFPWYNTEHYHSGLGLMTPEDVHYGRALHIIRARQEVLLGAYKRQPERFKGRIPKPDPLPAEVWVNKPSPVSDGGIH